MRRATTRLGLKGLATVRRNGVVLIVDEDLQWADLAKVLDPEGEGRSRMGVGGRYPLVEVKRSLGGRRVRPDPHEICHRQASGDLRRARRLATAGPPGRERPARARRPLDRARSSTTTVSTAASCSKTLIAYLNEFGALEATASQAVRAPQLLALPARAHRRAHRLGPERPRATIPPRSRLPGLARPAGARRRHSRPSRTTATNGNGAAKAARLLARRPGAGTRRLRRQEPETEAEADRPHLSVSCRTPGEVAGCGTRTTAGRTGTQPVDCRSVEV